MYLMEKVFENCSFSWIRTTAHEIKTQTCYLDLDNLPTVTLTPQATGTAHHIGIGLGFNFKFALLIMSNVCVNVIAAYGTPTS